MAFGDGFALKGAAPAIVNGGALKTAVVLEDGFYFGDAGAVTESLQSRTVNVIDSIGLVVLPQTYLLTLTNSKSAIHMLIDVLEHEDSYVRGQAVDALGQLGSEAAIPGLIGALEHEDSYVRRQAVVALGRLGSEAAIPGLIDALEQEDFYVRGQAAEALGRLGSEAAIPGLIGALEHKNSDIRSKAVVALSKLGDVRVVDFLIKTIRYRGVDNRRESAYFLGILTESASLSLLDEALIIKALVEALDDKYLTVRRAAMQTLVQWSNSRSITILQQSLPNSSYTDAFQALAGIQEKCKFYSYDLTQTLVPASIKENIIQIVPENPSAHSPMTIINVLHLSDLHFGTVKAATLWANQLATDLSNELSLNTIDTLILSGDIANYATPEEYTVAQSFIESIRQDLQLSPNQIIIVPGNHDLSWDATDPERNEEAAYKLKFRSRYTPEELSRENFIPDGERFVLVRNDDQYKQRFANFNTFYQIIKGVPYPLDYAQQYTLDHLPQQNLLILGLNSAWNLDHHFKDRVSIHPEALTNALTKIRRNADKYSNCRKIAVWHHPLDSPYTDRITDQSFLEQLAVAGFRLFLHGHIHKAETNQFRYDMSTGGRKLDRICAGTFGAPTHELTTATPWQYNLLQFKGNTLTVRTRKRESENGAWKPDTRWLQGPGKPALDYYTIDL